MRIFLLIFSLVLHANAFNFLVVSPVFGYSHIKFMSKVADTLADGGHNVTLLQTYMVEHWGREIRLAKNKNVKIIDYHLLSENSAIEDRKTPSSHRFAHLWDSERLNGVLGAFLPMFVLYDEFRPMLARAIGEPSLLNYAPTLSTAYGPQQTFWDRLQDIPMVTSFYYALSSLFDRQYGQAHSLLNGDVRNWKEIVQTATFFFYNNNPYVGFPMPILEKSVEIGGITIEPATSEKVDEEFDRILNLRNSTVLMSFGTVVLSVDMPERFKNGIIAAFSSLPDTTFIWKYEEADEQKLRKLKIPANVILKKWVPQPALLADNRLSLFVTHGGLGSTLEVAYSGKPSIIVPVFGDQLFNAKMLSRHGGAIAYDKYHLADGQLLTETLQNALSSESMLQNSQRLAKILQNQPFSPKSNFLRHAEFAAKFGRAYMLDAYAVYILLLGFMAWIIFRIMDLFNGEGEEPERNDSEEPVEMEDEELEDVELAPKGKQNNKKRKRTSSEDSSMEDNSPKGDKKKVKGPLSNTNKSINVGKDFQAVIEENEDLTNFRDYTPDREQAYWEHHGDVDTDELEQFVNEKSAKYLVPIDRVLFILMEKKMNYREAAIEIAKRNILQDGWKDDERFAFENSFTHVGKNFHQMHAAIAHRSLRSIIHYYYDSKKSITYRAFATKSITEVETLEEFEPAVEKQPAGVFENMCENCGERAEKMMWNEQMNRIECNACLIYFRNMLVPRPTSLRLVMDERFDGQIPCPDTIPAMRDMMKCYNRLAAPATGKTFELRKVKDLFSMDQIVRTKKSNCKRFRIPPRFLKTDLKNLPVNRSFYMGGEPIAGPGAFDRAFDTLNGVVEKLEREINSLPLTVDVREPPEEDEEGVEVVEEAAEQGLLMVDTMATGSEDTPEDAPEVEPSTEAKQEEEEVSETPETEPEVKQEESPEEPAPNSENPSEEPVKDSSESPEKSSDSSEASKGSSSEETISKQAPETTEVSQNPEESKSPEETPRSSESPEKKPKRKSLPRKKIKLSSSSINLSEMSAKKSKKSKKSTESSLNVPSSSNGTKLSGRPPGGPSMYIWHNKRKTQCQEEIEVLLDDSRRKLFEAGQHSSKIDYKQVNNWKNDMAALRERMHKPNLDMDLYPQIVYAGERTRFARDWTEEDHKNVQRLFRWYGPNFQQIADVMGNKTADQVYNFYLSNQEAIELDHEEFTRHAGKAVELADERKCQKKLGL
ncbi:unnamed protein product [Caenorhabditis brenneri]